MRERNSDELRWSGKLEFAHLLDFAHQTVERNTVAPVVAGVAGEEAPVGLAG